MRRANRKVGAPDASGEPNAGPVAATPGNLGTVNAVSVLMRDDHEIRFLQHHPHVVPAHLDSCAPAEALVAGDDLFSKLASQALGPQQFIKGVSDLLLLLAGDQIQKLQIATD